MKSIRIKMAALLSASAFLLAGCGEQFFVLSPEEEMAVISYASHVVAKYNKLQQDGEVFVEPQLLAGEAASEESAENAPSEEAPAQDSQAGSETDGQNMMTDAAPEEAVVSLGEALLLQGIHAEYMGSSLCMSYEQSEVHVVDAGAGSRLLVLNIRLSNPGDTDAGIDLLEAKPSIQAVINETQTAMAQMTILPHDLSAYQGVLPAKAEVDTVLVFQIPQDITEITGLILNITVNGTAQTVNLGK